MEPANVVALDKPTKEQIEELVQLSLDAFAEDILIDTVSGGIRELKAEFYRIAFRAIALEGRIFVFRESGSGRIVSVSAALGPGVEFMGSEAQRALGFSSFFKRLPDDTQKWWKEHLMNPNRRTNPEVKRWWKLWVVATAESERRKGYATLLINEFMKLAEKEGVAVGTNATVEESVAFYDKLGFKIFEQVPDESKFGTWVNTRMVWEPVK